MPRQPSMNGEGDAPPPEAYLTVSAKTLSMFAQVSSPPGERFPRLRECSSGLPELPSASGAPRARGVRGILTECLGEHIEHLRPGILGAARVVRPVRVQFVGQGELGLLSPAARCRSSRGSGPASPARSPR